MNAEEKMVTVQHRFGATRTLRDFIPMADRSSGPTPRELRAKGFELEVTILCEQIEGKVENGPDALREAVLTLACDYQLVFEQAWNLVYRHGPGAIAAWIVETGRPTVPEVAAEPKAQWSAEDRATMRRYYREAREWLDERSTRGAIWPTEVNR